jgi:hypothetical protein
MNKLVARRSRNQLKAPDLMLIVDSKSIRSSEYLSKHYKGYDGNKHIKGIKLCPVLDRLRRCWRITTTPANQSEHRGVTKALEQTLNSKIRPYSKLVIGDRYFDSIPLQTQLKIHYNLDLIALQKRPKRKFHTPEDEILRLQREENKKRLVNPYRYIVEQFFAHIEKARRLVMVYERRINSYTGFVKLRVIQLLLKRFC